jgi:hypothetical protein
MNENNIDMDDNTMELYIAKNIATTFQRLRKIGGFHVYDKLRLIMKNNKYSEIVDKHMEYIYKTTRVNIELIDESLTDFSFNKQIEVNDETCDMYLVKASTT